MLHMYVIIPYKIATSGMYVSQTGCVLFLNVCMLFRKWKKILCQRKKRLHFSEESSLKVFILKIPNYKEQNNKEI